MATLNASCTCAAYRLPQCIAQARQVGTERPRFGDKVNGAGVERAERCLGAPCRPRAEHDDRRRERLHDLPHRAHAIEPRHLDIHRDDIGPQFERPLDRFDAIGRRTDHDHAPLGRKQPFDGTAHERGIIDNEHAKRLVDGSNWQRHLAG